MIPDIKSFSGLPRGPQELSAKVNERYLDTGRSRRTFQNGTLKADMQWLHTKPVTDLDQPESEKVHNYTNYQIVCMLQNIDDLAKDVLEVKEHIKRLHTSYDALLGDQHEHSQQLNDINSNMGSIAKSLEQLKNALPAPVSPPH